VQDGIEECRKLCGGHGYLWCSGLPELFAVYVPACTYEGDNVVLQLQVFVINCELFSLTRINLSAQIDFLACGSLSYVSLDFCQLKLLSYCELCTFLDMVNCRFMSISSVSYFILAFCHLQFVFFCFFSG